MIISKIRGGLGNQLFQWSAGFALASKYNTPLLLDTSVYERNLSRRFELDKLSLPFALADQSQSNELQQNVFYKQPHFHFDSQFGDLQDNCFIRGYFCSEKYFLSSAPLIKSHLNEVLPQIDLSSDQIEVLEAIDSGTSISIHIRRGDYVADPRYNDFFGVCPVDYYSSAIAELQQKIKDDVTFFIFSDDLTWAEENIKLAEQTVYVGVNRGQESYLDLFFMSRCKHNIIANSTFSWWAAWLNKHEDQVVFAPKKWFKSNYREKTGRGIWIKSPHYDFNDLFPARWITL